MLSTSAGCSILGIARQLGCVPGLLAHISSAARTSSVLPAASSSSHDAACAASTSCSQPPPHLRHSSSAPPTISCQHAPIRSALLSSLLPSSSSSTRSINTMPDWFVRLNNLHDNPGATKARRRVGRGTGGGRGKTCGRGHKGQKARKGNKPHLLFDGGAKMLRKLPKQGGRPSNPVVYDYVNLGKIAQWIEQGRLDPSQVITMKELRDSGCASKHIVWGVKLLAKGGSLLKTPINIQVSACSATARTAVEAAGGSVTTVYYTQLGLRALLKPENFEAKGRTLPRPVRTWPPRDNGKFDIVGDIPPAPAALATA